jgi:hypothetical protein
VEEIYKKMTSSSCTSFKVLDPKDIPFSTALPEESELFQPQNIKKGSDLVW